MNNNSSRINSQYGTTGANSLYDPILLSFFFFFFTIRALRATLNCWCAHTLLISYHHQRLSTPTIISISNSVLIVRQPIIPLINAADRAKFRLQIGVFFEPGKIFIESYTISDGNEPFLPPLEQAKKRTKQNNYIHPNHKCNEFAHR